MGVQKLNIKIKPKLLLAIDPGPTESAYCWLDRDLKPLEFDKIKNEDLLKHIYNSEPDMAAIEMIASYGMAVGAEVFQTCVWIGRFTEAVAWAGTSEYVYRKEVKMHLCGSMKAKDTNIRTALMDRFGEVGTKNKQGYFYGFKRDIWAAYAVGLTYLETRMKGEPKR